MARRIGGINPRLIDQHNRVVLTQEVLDTLKVKAGDHVSFGLSPEGHVILRKVLMSLE